jgi:flagellin
MWQIQALRVEYETDGVIRRNNMALTVATNTGALMAQAAASSVNKEMETSMERLSTGKRINAASDDAAGVAIASRLTSEITGTNMAIRNAMDAQALIDTAEGAHQEVTNILQRMRELAVQSANDTNSNVDRSNLQSEITQLQTEIDRIANTTSWAGIKLMDGSFTTKKFQVGSGSGAAHQISTSMGSMNAASIGSNRIDGTAFAAAASTTATETLDTTTFNLTGNKGASTITMTAADSVKTVATKVNAATSSTGVTATAVTNLKLSSVGTGVVTFSLTGNAAASISATVTSASDLTALKNAINNVAGTSGVTAAFDGTSKAALILTDVDGDDIIIEGFASASASNQTAVVQAMNYAATTVSGSAITLTEANNDSTAVHGVVRLESSGTFTVDAEADASANAIADATTGYFGNTTSTSSSLAAVSGVDVGTLAGARAAIDSLDGALRMVSAQRADLGAVSNRIDSTVSNLTNISSNLQAGRGRIEDADFAAETTNLAKAQILQQASTAMLAQANAAKQNVLSLLQG